MRNRNLLIFITVLVFCVLAVVVMDYNRKTPGEDLAGSVNEVTEEVQDEIDDATDAR